MRFLALILKIVAVGCYNERLAFSFLRTMSEGDQAIDVSSPKTTVDDPIAKAPPLSKINVIFKAVGDAPIVKDPKWAVPLSKTVGWVNGVMRSYLKMDASESLFLYVRQSFAPSPDQTIENLYHCFGGGDGKLILHYSKTQAWG